MSPSKAQVRSSTRVKENDNRRVLDDAQRRHRQRRLLEMLESDNYQADPHGNLVMSKKAPKFEDEPDQKVAEVKKKVRDGEYYQTKFGKNLNQLVYEDQVDAARRGRVSYMDVAAEESNLPQRHFCSVCGLQGRYCCMVCGMRFCSTSCNEIHKNTRCLKWVA